MFKLILIVALIASFGLLVASDDKVDDFDDWSSESENQETQDEVNKPVIVTEAPPKSNEPVSHIQKIPRRGEKTTESPASKLDRKRRDTLSEGPVKEKKRGNKNRQKEAIAEISNEGSNLEQQVDTDPSATPTRNGKAKKVRKPKSSRKPKNDDQTGQSRKERKNKKDKTRKPKEGKQHRQPRPTKVRKEKGQHSHKIDTNKQ